MRSITAALLFVMGTRAASERDSRLDRSFVIRDDSFYLDGEPMQIMSGEFHYSRAPEAQWRDRLQRLVSMGLNAVATYVPWNFHEGTQGNFDFVSEGRNITRFVEIAQVVGRGRC